ncbi:hypothetical protein [Domibacillus indicus]|uniref:hypothetical protein n=1 Tax=Domibacillus indicus TaxID=1437523 RepID=UPI000617B1CF|nr:hypothetical protein [Domibacillus indicus]
MDRIYFLDNPWPQGHRIIDFKWNAHFKYEEEISEKNGLYFDFHLETADYYEEDADEEDMEEGEEESDWKAKIVWNNYHSCTLSSEEWSYKGFLAGNDKAPFNLEELDGKKYKVDFLSEEEQEEWDPELTAFDVYLLGHDAAAFHTIRFTKNENGAYRVDWKGKLALAYVGDYEFKYDFQAFVSSVSFRGIAVPDELTDQEACGLLKRFVRDPALFELQNQNGQRRFVLK